MADASPSPGRWAFRPMPPEPRSVVELIRAGTLDAQLAATLWLLIEARVPIVVAAEGQGAGKSTLLGALLDVPAARRPGGRAGRRGRDLRLAAAGGGARLARGRGCPAPNDARRPTNGRVDASGPTTPSCSPPSCRTTCPSYTWGAEARIAIRAASIGYGLAATIHADFARRGLRRPAPPAGRGSTTTSCRISASSSSCAGSMTDRRRVVAAHYVRPIARDMHGHVQRLGPGGARHVGPGDATRSSTSAGGSRPSWRVRVGRPRGRLRDRGRPPARPIWPAWPRPA